MPRNLRLQFPGAYYHVMARGNRREAIFHDAADRRIFLATLAEACGMTGWRVRCWVLMGNLYHMFIETPELNLVAGMGGGCPVQPSAAVGGIGEVRPLPRNCADLPDRS